MTPALRSFILAVQFLTRLPTPQVPDFNPEALSRASGFFPLAGALVGAFVALAMWVGTSIDPWVGAIFALVAWIGVTGALHLDGLSDMADAMGAAHRDPSRFHAVLKDPHIGAFGVVTLVAHLLMKAVLLLIMAREGAYLLLIPLCAWSRLGPLLWAHYLPVLKDDAGNDAAHGDAASGGRFAWSISPLVIWAWVVGLLGTAFLSPAFMFAPAILFGWGLYLHIKLGGQTGDLLGAGIEISETALLLVLVVMIH
ncbi:MAG: adenosylcobinamide-GDP ribazoletransferase [Parvibaculum sp.]